MKSGGLLQRRDNRHETALITALRMTGEHCSMSNRFPECTQCSCSDTLAMLLGAVQVVTIKDLSHDVDRCTISTRGWRLFISELRASRQRLKELASRHIWAVQEYSDYLCSDQTLDLHAQAVYKGLISHGIEVPVEAIPVDGYSAGDCRTVYQILHNPQVRLCELLFNLGFQDVDNDTQHGSPPLCNATKPDYINWLLDRGADLKRRIQSCGDDQSQARGIFTAHYVLYNLFQDSFDQMIEGDMVPSNHHHGFVEVLIKALPVSLADSCVCACSTDGCTPFLYMMHKMARDRHRFIEESVRLDFRRAFEGIPTDNLASLYLAAMRAEAFIALGITHTCCKEHGISNALQAYPMIDRDEIDEIQEEESRLIETLDDMVDEFQARIAHMSHDLEALEACWKDFWTYRVPQILGELEGGQLTDSERLSAEQIGVVWESRSESDEVSGDLEEILGNPNPEGTVDWFDYELKSIVGDI